MHGAQDARGPGGGGRGNAPVAQLACSPRMDEAEARVRTLSAVTAAPGPAASTAAAEVAALVAAGAVRSDDARVAAAEVLLRSGERAHVALCQDLALGLLPRHRAARELAARAFDRLRVLDGLPQKFGTQRGPDGAEWPCDPATTDSERSKWGIPPLAVLRAPGGS